MLRQAARVQRQHSEQAQGLRGKRRPCGRAGTHQAVCAGKVGRSSSSFGFAACQQCRACRGKKPLCSGACSGIVGDYGKLARLLQLTDKAAVVPDNKCSSARTCVVGLIKGIAVLMLASLPPGSENTPTHCAAGAGLRCARRAIVRAAGPGGGVLDRPTISVPGLDIGCAMLSLFSEARCRWHQTDKLDCVCLNSKRSV